jgi:uncharacterized GH25 family protein
MKHFLLFLFAGLLCAHDLYLMPQKFRAAPGETILLSAHTGDSFPASEQPVDPSRLTAAPALPGITWRMLGKATHTKITVQSSQNFAVETAPKLIELPAEKFLSYLLEEGLQHVIDLRKAKGETATAGRELYGKYAKTYVHTGPDGGERTCAQPMGLRIEFVPQADLGNLRPGDQLPVVLLGSGKPLPDTQVLLAISEAPTKGTQYLTAGRTDAQGRIIIKLPSAGKMRLHAIEMNRVQKPTHDWESFWASLTFEVPASPAGASGIVSSR